MLAVSCRMWIKPALNLARLRVASRRAPDAAPQITANDPDPGAAAG